MKRAHREIGRARDDSARAGPSAGQGGVGQRSADPATPTESRAVPANQTKSGTTDQIATADMLPGSNRQRSSIAKSPAC